MSVTRRSGVQWLPHAVPAAGWEGGYLLPAAALAAGVVLAFLSVAVWRTGRQAVTLYGPANVLTAVAAVMASTVSATGMWVFFSTYVPEPVLLRCVIFAFLEVATLSAAFRARDNMREFSSSGVDGLVMWLLTAGSALLASTAATSVPEALLRLLVPLVAAGLWERALVSERRLRDRVTGGREKAATWWRRLLVRTGLADPAGRSISDAAAARRVTVLALAAARVALLEAAGAKKDGWQLRGARRRRQRALLAAVEHAGLAGSPQLQADLAAQVQMLGSAAELSRLAVTAPWTWLPPQREQEEEQDGGPGELEKLAGELAAAQRDGDHARLHELLDGREDLADLALWAATTGAPKRLLAAIALHAGQEQLSAPAAAIRWIVECTGQDSYVPDRSEIARARKYLFPGITATGDQPAATPLPAAALTPAPPSASPGLRLPAALSGLPRSASPGGAPFRSAETAPRTAALTTPPAPRINRPTNWTPPGPGTAGRRNPVNTETADEPDDSAGPRLMAAADGTPYTEALNNAAPEDVRGAVADGILLWSVPWRGAGQPYFEVYDTSVGPVLKTDIFIGWAYAWDWPDAAAAVRHVRRHTAEADLAEGYLRYPRVTILLAGPWGTVIEQSRHVRAILHTEHGPETRWYRSRPRALDAAAAHVRDAVAWSARLRGSDPGARAAERREAVEAVDAAIATLTPVGQADADPDSRAPRDAAEA